MHSSSKSGDEFSVYVRNLDPNTPPTELEGLLYELFLQAGPLCRVHLPSDRSTGVHKGYGFVEFMHKESIPYATRLLEGIKLLGRPLTIRPAGAQSTPSTPGGGTGMRNGDSPSAVTPGNPFQHVLDHTHPMYPHHPSSIHSPFPPTDFRPPSLDPLPPHNHSPMESPRRYPASREYPPMESPHGCPPPMESPHGFPFYFSPSNPHPYALLPPPPPFTPPPPLPPLSPMELERSLHRHHESRLHPRDHPRWLKEDLRDRLSRHHQHELERHPHSRRLSHEDSHDSSSHEEPRRQSTHEELHRRSSYEGILGDCPTKRSSHEGSRKHYH